ncbi:hypothetical protein Poli38472_012934 [Pythium oligandrum]|uniref:Uncharacterized protein n=1 Tax=Pythium oligandrum TaxID=41045 RepID=A0A8K1CIZ2_PYTOL|nr:hypothetical protein Poli38472_012934 [Pythium oligandrum]|eukprot:TMW64312.1 hypothetical protein Poli38472_012934 [Pythium oligandrum]
MGGSSSKNRGATERRASSALEQSTKRQQARAQVTSKDKAILELKNARDRLKKYQARLDIEAQQLHETAKQLALADKRERAKLALKVKKFKEQQIRQADDHLLKVLEMLDTVEWESQQLKVFEGLKAGNSVLDAIHKEMSVEAVENLMLETEEAQETEREISRLLGSSLTVDDEDAILAELAEIERLEAQELEAALPEAPSTGLETGLTMGLLSLDMLNMRILEMEGSDEEKKRAARVLPILSQHHNLLVTLLLVNAGANEALPIFLSKLVPESVSIILSVTCVLIFGEILPSAVFTGPNQLRIAAALTPGVRVLMFVAAPIAYPIARCLDYFLGSDHDIVRYKRQELKALVALQRETNALRKSFLDGEDGHHLSHHHGSPRNPMLPITHEDLAHHSTRPHTSSSFSGSSVSELTREHSAQGTRLHVDEVTIIHGALDLSSKNISEVMIPISQVFMLEFETKLDENVMADILASGHSRIPIYKDYPSNVVGLLLVKRLIVVDPEDERPVRDLSLRKPIVVTPEESCYHILNEFQKGRSHIALVTKDAKLVMECWANDLPIPPTVNFVGIITIEDVIEELIQEEIEDESDVYVHGVVDYWRTMAERKARTLNSDKTAFVRKKLKQLAERARKRVQNRRTLAASALNKKSMAAIAGTEAALDAPLQIRVVTENTPLVPKNTSV